MRLFINKLQTIQLGNISFQYKSIVASTFRSGLKDAIITFRHTAIKN